MIGVPSEKVREGAAVNPTEELCAKLDELGIKYTTDNSDYYEVIEWEGPYNLWWQFVYDTYEEEPYGELRLREVGGSTHLTPDQAIAATVGNRTDLSKRLREVTGLHSFAELFGFSWTDDSDWDWHDVACAMADAVDAATVGAVTCHMEVHDNLAETEGMGDVWLECDKCHWQMPLEPSTPRFRYCPNCRAKAVGK